MLRIYVAGPYSADTVLEVCKNIRRGRELVQQIEEAGFAPYDPWADFDRRVQYGASLESCYATARAWLEVADAVALVDGWESSVGACAEVERAREVGIPVFENWGALMLWAEGKI